jgi:PST family polysaccharide transporter
MPTDYGLMALTSLFIYYINYFNELSIGTAIIQSKEIDETDLSSAFWLTLGMSILTCAATFLLAGAVASFFSQSRLELILKVSSASFIIMALGVIPYSIVSRELKFSITAKVNAMATTAMGLTAVSMAFLGYGVWSLVIGSIVKNSVFTVLMFRYSPWRPKFLLSYKKSIKLLKFGIPLTGAKSLHTLYYNADNLIVGRFLGDILLGYYYMAFNLSTMLVSSLTRLVNEVNLPILSRLNHDKSTIGPHLLKTSTYTSLITFPMLTGMALVAEDFIYVVLGAKWLPILIPIKMFCIIGILRTINATLHPLLVSAGRTDLLLRYSIAAAIMLPGGFLLGVQYGINGVASAWLIVFPLLTFYLLHMTLNEINLNFIHYLKSLIPAATSSAFMAIIVYLVSSSEIDIRILRLGLSIGAGAVSYLLFIFVIHRPIINESKDIIRTIRKKRVEE